MAKKRRSRKASKMTLPISIALPMGALVYRGSSQIRDKAWGAVSRDFTGWDVTTNQATPGNLIFTYGPLLAGVVIHKAANRFGVNKTLAAAKIPFLRI